MRKMIILGSSKIYHEKTCRYLKNADPSKRIYVNPKKALKRGCRACKYCGTVSFHLNCKRKVLDRFIKGKDMEYKVLGDAMYVRTEISCWKIVYDPENAAYRLYHRNKSDKPIDFDNPESESYHLQRDKQNTKTVDALFKYIRSHDSFRKSEQETGGNTKMTNISPKYRRHFIKQKRRKEQRRVDSLFAMLERKNPEYIALSRC